MAISTAEFAKRAAIFVAIALVPVLVWYLFNVILMAVGAIILAALLQLGAEPFIRWLGMRRGWALIVSGLLVVAIIGGAGYLFGTQLAAEFQEVIQRASQAQKSLSAQLQSTEFGQTLLSHTQFGNVSISDVLTKVFSLSTSFLEAVVVTVVTGLYLAAQPRLYREGLVELFPPRWRANAVETIDDVSSALRLWLLAQLIQMVVIGLLSTFAVWMIGLPSPLALGIIAGVTEFIPYLGPILAAIPALLVAATQGLDATLWTLAAYIIIHQTEGNLIVPLMQRRMLFIPPAVILLGIVAISFLFGPIAIVFAAPIAVILFVLTKKLYLRDTLGEQTDIPGESK
ncbi:MAG TPA: AI-2E family transporter [Xanthobacteraceae bacterium]|jgi:predicted PurR-regulated permease PerM|nr:AI-2E family transporter [Xanthobacteraceae bacterium]